MDKYIENRKNIYHR